MIKSLRSGFLVATLAIFCSGVDAPSAQAGVFYPESYRLANGLRVIIVKNKLAPAVAQMLWYKAGGVDSPDGASGVAHYLEHLMFRGTEKVPAGGFSAWVAGQGGQDNAFTTQDATAYHAIVAPDRLGALMQLEADRMKNLQIRAATALPELRVVQSERQERTDNGPEGIFGEKLNAALFPHHPYGKPVIGWREDLEAMTPAKAQDFYATHYAPNNAVLVVSGSVETQEVLRLAAGTFGRIPPRKIAPPRRVDWPETPTQSRVEMADARVKLPQFHHLVVVDSEHTAPRKAAALDVLSEVLGGEVGLLYRQLVRTENLAATVGVGYDSTARGPSVFSFSVLPASGVADALLEQRLFHALKILAKKGIPDHEIRKAKARLDHAALFARDSLMAPCEVFGEALTTGGDIADVERWPDKIQRVSSADVNAALRLILATPRHVTGWLRPHVSSLKMSAR